MLLKLGTLEKNWKISMLRILKTGANGCLLLLWHFLQLSFPEIQLGMMCVCVIQQS